MKWKWKLFAIHTTHPNTGDSILPIGVNIFTQPRYWFLCSFPLQSHALQRYLSDRLLYLTLPWARQPQRNKPYPFKTFVFNRIHHDHHLSGWWLQPKRELRINDEPHPKKLILQRHTNPRCRMAQPNQRTPAWVYRQKQHNQFMHMVANNFIYIHKPAEITIPLLRRHLQAPDRGARASGEVPLSGKAKVPSQSWKLQGPEWSKHHSPTTGGHHPSDQLQEIIKKTYFGWLNWHFWESPNPNPLFFDMHPDLLRMGRRWRPKPPRGMTWMSHEAPLGAHVN